MPKQVQFPIAWMLKQYKEGKSVDEITTALGEKTAYWMAQCGRAYQPDAGTVYKVLDRAGCVFRDQGQPPMELHWNWKGGRTIDKQGYVLIKAPDHPKANSEGYVREHRLVMEREIGRYLTEEEVVHHIDVNKSNNDISNLMLFANNSEHLAYELKGVPPKYLRDKWEKEGKTPT